MKNKNKVRVIQGRYHITDTKKYIVLLVTDSFVKQDAIEVLLDKEKLECKMTNSHNTIINQDTMHLDPNMETQWLLEMDLPQGYEQAKKLMIRLKQAEIWKIVYGIDIRTMLKQRTQQYHQIAECEFRGEVCIIHGECALLQPIVVKAYTLNGTDIPVEVTWLPRAETRCYYPEYGYLMFSDYQLQFNGKDMDQIVVKVVAGDRRIEQSISLKQKRREWQYRLDADQGMIGKVRYYGYRFMHEAGRYTLSQWREKLKHRLAERQCREAVYYEQWLQEQKMSSEELERQETHLFEYHPSIGQKNEDTEYVILAPEGTVCEPNLIYECRRFLNQNPDADVIYTDSDRIGTDGQYQEPAFKPDYNPDLLRSENYIGENCVIRRTLYDEIRPKIKPEKSEGTETDMWDLYLACMEQQAVFGHIPKMLCHVPEQEIQPTEIRHVTYDWKEQPLVSILIPSKDHIEELGTCISSIEETSTYRNYEILVIENNSTEQRTFDYYKELEQIYERVRILYYDGEFNYSKINNFGAHQAKGEYLLLLNNDTELIAPESIWELLSHAMRPEVGIVGARLYFPDDTIQHAGVIIGYGGVAGHAFLGFAKDDPGYQNRIRCIQDYSAVTAACMMIPKNVYDEVGGLSEEYRVAFNDIDFCLKVREVGYLVVYNPYAELYHYESKSRGCDNTEEKMLRYQQEVQLFTRRWRKILLEGDPYYNRNLSLDRKDFSVR